MIAGSFLYRGRFFLRHDFAEELDHLVMVGFARIAREARRCCFSRPAWESGWAWMSPSSGPCWTGRTL